MRRARSIMIQGTMSNVGKSIIVAGLCRVFAREGLRVAPFKSQNMALNSGVTSDGLEMGRAQILQARAAGVEPSVLMNPILLKPTSDTGSQVIVEGKPIATMHAREYGSFRSNLKGIVERDYEELAQTHDVIVIEGAGSPVEINLNADDIVNMGMARIAQAPVLLVGDIDPGGVFAQLCGTIDLLSSRDKAYVKGLIINKFRGDLTLLAPGFVQLKELTGVDVLGALPYINLDLDDEDSLSEKLSRTARDSNKPLDIAVIRLPHLSNFTDFDELARHPLVGMRYVREAAGLGRPDFVVLPGTKATMDDLRWLRSTGLDQCIVALARGETPVLGICGGYQMLGAELVDPTGSDGGGNQPGLGLLPICTVFSQFKRTVRVEGSFNASASQGIFACLHGASVEGYEIHMGQTQAIEDTDTLMACDYAVELNEKNGQHRLDGMVRDNVMGTYVHGVLDNAQAVNRLVRRLLSLRGLEFLADTGELVYDRLTYQDQQLDLLADTLQTSLDMQRIHRIVEEGVEP